MIVMKFGGSSVSDADRIRRVAGIVRARLKERPVVVVSAMRGITDDLLALAQEALGGDERRLEKIRQRHLKTCGELGVDPAILQDNLNELAVLTKGISLVKELTPRTLDYVAGFGERLSVRMIASAFSKLGLPAAAHDAFDVGMLTDDNFGGAMPVPEAFDELRRLIPTGGPTPVITGYIGKSRRGDLTTLGRNGSDFTASIVGAALRVAEIQIWTDVDGVMTADPTVVPEARPIDRMTFQEASELAYYGGRVLHPSTIAPAIERNISVRVLNTFKPEHPGTLVVAEDPGRPAGPRAVAHKKNQIVVSITTPRMLMGHGFLARIFEVFGRHKIVINMVSTSEVSVSVTTDSPERLEAAVRELRQFAEVTAEPDRAIVCVVGEGLRTTPGIAAKVFGAVREAGVNVLMISQGASKINLAFVVTNEDAHPTAAALHRAFFA
jgi:aspartate kinase